MSISKNRPFIKVDATGAIDQRFNDVNAQLANTMTIVNISESFDALGDDSTDNTSFIQNALDYAVANNINMVYLSAGTYRISGTLNIPSGIHFKGDGANNTIIKMIGNTSHALSFETESYRTKISDMEIMTPSLYGTDNSGLYFDPSIGGKELVLENLIIDGFKYGIYHQQRWWMNIINNVRINLCDISIFGDDSSGTCINNLFTHCYSDRPATGGFRLRGYKNSEIQNCNFGGRKGLDDTPTYSLFFSTNSEGIKITSCNFEHHVAPSNGIVQVWSGSAVSIDTVNFFNIMGESNVGFLVNARDSARVNVQNCNTIQEGADLRGIKHLNYSELVVGNNEGVLNDIESTSTKKVINLTPEESSGLAWFSGDGVTTQFSIPHELSEAPTSISIVPRTSVAAGTHWVNTNATDIKITFGSAPYSATDNVAFWWCAKV